MSLASLKLFIRQKDVKIVIICTVVGGIAQVVAKRYLKNHPEFLKNEPVTKKIINYLATLLLAGELRLALLLLKLE